MPWAIGTASRQARVLAYVALGANQGDAAAALRQAVQDIGKLPLTALSACSSLYCTAPLDTDADTEQPAPGQDYLNAVVALETGLAAPVLLDALQCLEQQAGRTRSVRNAPRTLDLDVLLYGSGHIESARLVVPHPRMGQRAFVLVPLAEIAPGLVDEARLQAVRHQKIAVCDSSFGRWR